MLRDRARFLLRPSASQLVRLKDLLSNAATGFQNEPDSAAQVRRQEIEESGIIVFGKVLIGRLPLWVAKRLGRRQHPAVEFAGRQHGRQSRIICTTLCTRRDVEAGTIEIPYMVEGLNAARDRFDVTESGDDT